MKVFHILFIFISVNAILPSICIVNNKIKTTTEEPQQESLDLELNDESVKKDFVIETKYDGVVFPGQPPPKTKKIKNKPSIGNSCSKLLTPINSASVCTNSEICRVTCSKGFATESGEESLQYICKNGAWTNALTGKAAIEKCKPKCEPACQNQGKCVMPNSCQCPLNFYGPLCEFEKIPCSSLPKTPMYSFRKCTSESCTMTCMAGKKFPDGSTIVEINCQDGKWIPSKTNWITVPDCIPECNPSCLNGGKCIDTDTCFCPENFRGEICQYPISVCDTSKLNFNGNYNCSGDEHQFSCELSCPIGMEPEQQLEKKYVCLYSKGKFTPENTPQCQIGRIIDGLKVSQYESKLTNLTPMPTTCMLWGQQHFKAFNGKILNFKSGCSFTLVRDNLENLFQIQVYMKDDKIGSVVIYINNEKYVLSKNNENKPTINVDRTGQQLSVPSQLTDLKVEIASGKSILVYLSTVNLYLMWNLENELQIDMGVEFWNRTSGLCGKGSNPLTPINLPEYVNNAVISSIVDKCDSPIKEEQQCNKEDILNAKKICSRINTDSIFRHCLNKIPIKEYIDTCEWSYCNCEKSNKNECICQFFSKFVQLCNQVSAGVKIEWRNRYNCSYSCPADQIYTNCLPISQATCTSDELIPTNLQKYCEEGCVCPSGTVLHNDKCITKETCSCMFRGQFYEPGSVISKDCNKCSCNGGKWSCTDAICKSECVILDPHFRTFDGKKYDFKGSCSYKLVSTENVSIEMDNSLCKRNLDEKIINRNEQTICSKSIVIHTEGKSIKLKDSQRILIDDLELEHLPQILNNNILIRKASLNLVQVILPNGLEILWNGINDLKIIADPSLFDKTKGLCGTFNNNQRDDLLTPEGDVEQSIISFANKWRLKENCEMEMISHGIDVCDINIQNKPIAEEYCKNLTSPIFEECHSVVNPQEYYEDCLSDLCSCTANNIRDCFCPVISIYAQKCAKNGIAINWREHIRQCGIQCPAGEKYKICGDTCQRSCGDLSYRKLCKENCIEDCYCPPGYIFNKNEKGETCIPISECPCLYKNQKYLSNQIDIRNETNEITSCLCKNAIWECKLATEEEIMKYKQQTSCPSANMEFVDCEPPEPLTCRNMHNPPEYSGKICYPGCICKAGYVLESVSKKCVKSDECPCHHGGRSYLDGEIMKEECNNCTCIRGKWECTKKECAATCASWGDSHFHTFDGQFYDFQGTCDYVFAKGAISDNVNFSVSVEIVPCGTGGTSCTKSVTLNVGVLGGVETVVFDKENKAWDKKFEHIHIKTMEMYVFAIIPVLSISLQWDKGTRVNLRVHPRWKNKLNGLCGNYNGNSLDDFQTPSGGLVEATPSLFADSWKLQQHCPLPPPIQDPCVLNPHRKYWAIEKCSFLKNNMVFKQCHSEVPVDDYYRRCVFDSCACDQGGDCECICTIFSAYAQECSTKGLHLKWRSQDLCPIQCDDGAEYSACVSPCPENTCNDFRKNNTFIKECQQISCVEGCEKKTCPHPHQLYVNSTSKECVSPMDCECINLEGTNYKENELISSDQCSSCYCSKGKIVCSGKPCTVLSSTSTIRPTELPIEASNVCVNGWSEWISVQRPFIGKVDFNNLKFENTQDKLNCFPNDIKNISCRSKTFSSSDFVDIPCNLNKAIHCKDECYEFQIKFDCHCSEFHGKTKTLILEKPPVTDTVCIEGWSQWTDISTPSSNKNNGEFETLDGLKQQEISICPLGYIVDIECKFRNISSPKRTNKWALKLKKPKFTTSISDLLDWKVSQEQDITCDKDVGFICNNEKQASGICKDYQIRVLCSCSPPGTETTIGLPRCPDGMEWSDCKIKCDQLCHYYKYQLNEEGKCLPPQKCIPGCVNITCPTGFFWRDETSCVEQSSCTCATENGTLAKPFSVHEDECKVCQCKQNEMACTKSTCFNEAKSTPVWEPYLTTNEITTESIELISPSVTLTPLSKCPFGSFITLDTQISYSASSSKSLEENPEYAKLVISGGVVQNTNSWKPIVSDLNQYFDIDLSYSRPVYGLRIAGDPSQSMWVKTFKILYSSDGISFSNLYAPSNSEIFRGPYDHSHPTEQIFNNPIETRYLRIKPLTWETEISLLLQVLGCETSSTPILVVSDCMDPMGIESGKMNSNQISVSSKLDDNFKPQDISLSSSIGWAPLVASSDQWIQFDFTGPRNISGVVTKGTELPLLNQPSWIEAYKIMYSLNGINWSPVVNDDKTDKMFPGNVDHLTLQTNTFIPLIRARYLKLIPLKWMNFPSLRMEILGCFEPYLIIEPAVIEEIPLHPSCTICPGIKTEIKCDCTNDTYWSGSKCVKKELCPCVEGLLTYSVGSTYMRNGCEKCSCSLGGNAVCDIPIHDCPNCVEKGLVQIMDEDCNCHCEKCPVGTLLCPTSNFCLNQSLWCNGFKECPDDESNCFQTTAADSNVGTVDFISTTPSLTIVESCPPIICPVGYYPDFSSTKLNVKNRSILKNVKPKKILEAATFNKVAESFSASERTHHGESTLHIEAIRSHLKSTNFLEYLNQQQMQAGSDKELLCEDWSCVPEGVVCTKPECPVNTKLTTKWTGESCPAYECIVLPPNEKECNINGKIINTFDGMSYIYDICDHILAQDKIYGVWRIRKINKCPLVGQCTASLIITLDNNTIELFTNLTASYNGYFYTLPQLEAIGIRNDLFVIQEVSNSLIIFGSTNLKFSIIWGVSGDLDSSLREMVDGLCGYFDFNIENDKSKPDGTIVISSQEFGDSWNSSDSDICNVKVCPKDVQTKAYEICKIFKFEPFNVCEYTINLDDYIVKCVESLCSCANSASNFDQECRCQMLERFASKCLSLQSGVDISLWRIKYECPVNCTAPFVYYDCYDRQCEPSCDSLLQIDECPRIKNKCFPGCYCPDGLIRKGNSCLRPSECRDCECSGNGITQFNTFDNVEIPFDGSCSSYILLQLKNENISDSELKIILTNSPCVNPYLKGICAHGITVVTRNNEILLAQSESNLNKVEVKHNNVSIINFPYENKYLKIFESPGKFAKLSIPSLQLDVTFMSHNKGFLVQLPSHQYSNKIVGLCGTCNLDQMDDIKTPSGSVPNSFKKFLNSWKTHYTADTEKRDCSSVSQLVSSFENFTIQCASPPENDPCLLFLNENIFGQCHPVVDPFKYVDRCHNLSCSGVNHCFALESYAEECQKHGICSEWRSANLCPYSCPEGFEYQACSLGCDLTCDNYKILKKSPSECASALVEKCVCPTGQVLLNGVCVNEIKCHPCDEDGHYIGDKWQEGNCLLCECSKDGKICQKKECAGDIICPLGFEAKIDNNNDDPCCVKRICVATFANNCSEPIKPVCGKNQLIKMGITSNNCTEYFCTCIPREECPPPDFEVEAELLPGMMLEEKKEGCCPYMNVICNQSICPSPPECPPFYVLHEIIEKACCPKYNCELPPHICLHEYQWIAEYNGTARKRLSSETYTEVKQINDTWFDGPCKQCTCKEGLSQSVCDSIICKQPEMKNLVMEPIYYYGSCCPTYKAIACKINDLIYEVGSSWGIESDPCKTMTCVKDSETGEISVKEVVQNCNVECGLAEKYVPSENNSVCCGNCVREACIDENKMLHDPNSNWTSENGCIKYECTAEVQIIAFAESCPSILGCPEEFIFHNGCCPECKQQPYSQTNCEAVSMPLNETVKLITKHDSIHGICINPDQITGFVKCDGLCDTSAYFDENSGKYSNTCQCCVGSQYETRSVVLTCDDGFSFVQDVQIPIHCICQSCGGE